MFMLPSCASVCRSSMSDCYVNEHYMCMLFHTTVTDVFCVMQVCDTVRPDIV